MIEFGQHKSERKVGDVNLTPMIDIIFNLLIFFLIVAVVSQKGLNLTLPKTSTAEKRPKKHLEIIVTSDARFLFDGQEIRKEEIEGRFTNEMNKAEEEKAENIILKADEEAPFGKFIYVMDTARKVGLKNLVIATEIKAKNAEGTQ